MAVTFTTTILQEEGMDATGISVPADVVSALGTSKRPKVKITLNGYTYRSTVAPYSGVFMLPLSKEHRAAAGVRGGDTVDVTLDLDLEPRIVDVPPELAAALEAKPGARAAFDALSYTTRKEHARLVTSAKATETRDRRIASILASLGGPPAGKK